MVSKIIYLIFLIAFTGCMNERGISLRYYNDCEEYYDLQGYYHKVCDKNIVDYKDFKGTFTPASTGTKSKVW